MRKRISMGRQALRDRRTDRKNACMTAQPVRRRLSIHGRVQGVFFRDSVRRIAAEHGVSGWAENRSDGSVEVVLEGERDAVDAVAAFCRHGPPHARVGRVEDREEPVEGPRGFEIR
jgi:acylphosphatase